MTDNGPPFRSAAQREPARPQEKGRIWVVYAKVCRMDVPSGGPVDPRESSRPSAAARVRSRGIRSAVAVKAPDVAVTFPGPAPAFRPPEVLPQGPVVSSDAAYVFNPIRKLALYAFLALVFFKFSLLHEYIAAKIGDPYVVLLTTLFAAGGTVMSGTMRRCSKSRITWMWTAFGLWLVLASVSSFWVGGSLSFLFKFYLRTSFILFFPAAALPINVREVKNIFLSMGFAVLVSGLLGRSFAEMTEGGRVAMSYGSIANSGDLAAFFVITLPFLLFLWANVAKVIVRVAILLMAGSNIYLVLTTATRAALIAFAVALVLVMIAGTPRLRLAILALAILGTVLAVSFLPKSVLSRYATLWGDVSAQTQEAEGSKLAREAVAGRAFDYMLHHPIFGVGPHAFEDYDAEVTKAAGKGRAQWLETHNGYLEVGSEEGVPALFFYVGAILTALMVCVRIYRRTRKNPQLRVLSSIAFSLIGAIAMLMVFLLFLSQAYNFWTPMFVGLALALQRAAENDPVASKQLAAPKLRPAF